MIVLSFFSTYQNGVFNLQEATSPVLALPRLQASYDQEDARQRESEVLKGGNTLVSKDLLRYTIHQ